MAEAEIVSLIIKNYFTTDDNTNTKNNISIGVITPYQSQKRKIDDTIRN